MQEPIHLPVNQDIKIITTQKGIFGFQEIPSEIEISECGGFIVYFDYDSNLWEPIPLPTDGKYSYEVIDDAYFITGKKSAEIVDSEEYISPAVQTVRYRDYRVGMGCVISYSFSSAHTSFLTLLAANDCDVNTTLVLKLTLNEKTKRHN